MSQVATTSYTLDLSPATILVRDLSHAPYDMVIKRGPATSGIKLCLRAKKGIVALATNVDSRVVEAIILATKGSLGALALDYGSFLVCQVIDFH